MWTKSLDHSPHENTCAFFSRLFSTR
jgi:hypothetical protein